MPSYGGVSRPPPQIQRGNLSGTTVLDAENGKRDGSPEGKIELEVQSVE